ncbi:hypothetical protein A2W14_05025 [Candidatus Gottesmanbacteria bacterium RBG_16_37_8]|uniref:Uncharacterized protein n=1 Tax=Candidatus Gottesmanbacteria bacterium RBG_16_37_8 TaxID=1798371 RepID=A0A1F5YUF3_9BACT|nr:MAG: hypothetical protein A2W14_05025 [Candidatus Gottesmanbacteria bacterium RBG_16_37_8]
MIKIIYQIITFNYLYITIFAMCFFLPTTKVLAQTPIQSGSKVTIEAQLPFRSYVRLYGYTSPRTIVYADAVRTEGLTVSDSNGFFVIDNLSLSNEAREICLLARDQEERTSSPLCLPVPQTVIKKNIGPIIMPPTLSLSHNIFYVGQRIYAEGKSLPNQQISIALFEERSGFIKRNLSKVFTVGTVHAFAIPQLEVKTDSHGNFNFSLPSAKSIGFRVFAKGQFQNNPIPNSRTIYFFVNPKSYLLLKMLIPLLLWTMLFTLLSVTGLIYDRKTGNIRQFIKEIQPELKILLSDLNEKKWRPAAAMIRLKQKRLWYNLREYLRLNQK